MAFAGARVALEGVINEKGEHEMEELKKIGVALFVVQICLASFAEWIWSEDMQVGRTDDVVLSNVEGKGLNYSGVANTSITVSGKLSIKGGDPKYEQALTGDSPKISIGPEAGDNALFQVEKTTINNDKVELVIGENGGVGKMSLGITSWANSGVTVGSFEVSENAVSSMEVLDALAIGHNSSFCAKTVKNSNAKPMRISFTGSTEGNQYRGRLVAVHSGQLFEIPRGDIILSGTFYAPVFIFSQWSWGYGLVKSETASSATSGYIEFASTDGTKCDVVLDCCSDEVEKDSPGKGRMSFNTNKIRWKNKGNVYLASSSSGNWNWPGKNEVVCKTGGTAQTLVANALPYGKDTGALIVHGTMLDLKGFDQKVNSMVVQNAVCTGNKTSTGRITNDGGKASITVGEDGVDGVLSGDLEPIAGEIDFVKVDGGTLVLSNATIKTLVVNGGSVRPAPGTVSSVDSLSISNADLLLKCVGDGSITCGSITKGDNAEVFSAEFTAGNDTAIRFDDGGKWMCPSGVPFVSAAIPEGSNYIYHIQTTTSAYTQYEFIDESDVTYYGRIVTDSTVSHSWIKTYLPSFTTMTFRDYRIGPYAVFHQGNGWKTYSIRGKFTVIGDGSGVGVRMGTYNKNGTLQFENGVLSGDEDAVIESATDYQPEKTNGLVFVSAENYRGSVRFDNHATSEDTFFTLGDTGDSALHAVALGTNMQFRAYAATDRVCIGDLTFGNDTWFVPQGTAEGVFSCVTVTNVLTLGERPVRVDVSKVLYPAKSAIVQRYPVLKWPTEKAAGTYGKNTFVVNEVSPRRHEWKTWVEDGLTCFGVEIPAKGGLILLFR